MRGILKKKKIERKKTKKKKRERERFKSAESISPIYKRASILQWQGFIPRTEIFETWNLQEIQRLMVCMETSFPRPFSPTREGRER